LLAGGAAPTIFLLKCWRYTTLLYKHGRLGLCISGTSARSSSGEQRATTDTLYLTAEGKSTEILRSR
jgi:hypothetical protein